MGTRSGVTTRKELVRAFLGSASATAVLVRRRRLALPRGRVGVSLAFTDGTRSVVYRETARLNGATADPALLVVQFRLRLIGRSRLMHRAFRAESLANTPLFAGFPGFRYKLWLNDPATGLYRGVYEWDGAGPAREYAETLCRLLAAVSEHGTVRYHVEPGTSLDAFLRDPHVAGEPRAEDSWWRLVDGVVA